MLIKTVFICVTLAILTPKIQSTLSETQLQLFLKDTYEKAASNLCTRQNEAEFSYETDINNTTKEEILVNITLESAHFEREIWKKYFKDLDPNAYSNEALKRQIKMLKMLGDAALDSSKLSNLTSTITSMSNIYSTAKLCPFQHPKCNLQQVGLNLEPGIEAVFSESSNYQELLYFWKAWRDSTGAKMKELYKNYITLSNEAAKANGFTDKGALWRDSFEDTNLIQNIDALWIQVEPLYAELHTYVGKKLKSKYGDSLEVCKDGLLPAHLFGNMWAQDWSNLADLVKPYPNASKVDVNSALKTQNYTILKMFQTSDQFYQSLGLSPNNICYDTNKGAMIEKPTDGREVLCHASAWDFCDGKNYRIKSCTEVNFEDFTTIHHEMGHIQYFLQYAKQPYNFRDGANPGFHEAIGDTIALSVATPKHLEKINLLQNYKYNEEASINALMDMALQKIAFLPFGLLIDKWRWDVFSGETSPNQWNSHWWHYRAKYQKLKPPVPRSESDFDPGAKFHVAGDSQYIAYFIAHILQFQFYRSFCIEAGEYNPEDKSKPLHNCDFYESRAVGDKLRAGLQLGSSVHWNETLKVMTGEKQLNAAPIMEYFQPLYEYLIKQNSRE